MTGWYKAGASNMGTFSMRPAGLDMFQVSIGQSLSMPVALPIKLVLAVGCTAMYLCSGPGVLECQVHSQAFRHGSTRKACCFCFRLASILVDGEVQLSMQCAGQPSQGKGAGPPGLQMASAASA